MKRFLRFIGLILKDGWNLVPTHKITKNVMYIALIVIAIWIAGILGGDEIIRPEFLPEVWYDPRYLLAGAGIALMVFLILFTVVGSILMAATLILLLVLAILTVVIYILEKWKLSKDET